MTAVGLNYSRLGTVASWYDVILEAPSVAAVAAATNDPRAAFHDGDPVPPLFGVVPTRRAVLAALRAAIPSEVSAAVPVLHGEHELSWQRPLRTGETLRVTGTAVGVQQKSSGTLVLLRIDTAAESGEPVGRQHLTIFLPGWLGERDAGEPIGSLVPLPTGGESAIVSAETTPDQSRRYGAASGDTTVFHMDDEAARQYGCPGVFMHGLCSLAVAVNGVVSDSGRSATDVRMLTARFTSPALPGERLVTTYWPTEAGAVGFSACAPDGRSVLDRGSIGFRADAGAQQ
jgi:acyl dehydratase